MNETPKIPLSMLAPGRSAVVADVRDTGRGMARRLNSMGLVAGAKVSVISAQGGPLLVRVGETRIAVARGMAHRVLVEEIS